jgi:putative PIN family toxin of toxin-antitoxin system
MNTAVKRVVFDCNVYFQALTSPRGPAARLVDFALNGDISLFVSKYTLDELADVAARPQLVAKYGLEEAVVAKFISNLRSAATCINSVRHIFDFPRDPDDAHYVDLAVAADAKLIVSRDKDLLSLRDTATAEGNDFVARFPSLEILTPPEALSLIEAMRPPGR